MFDRIVSVAAMAVLLLVCASGVAMADKRTFELRNGDRITGEVVERREDCVVVQHPILGRIEIPVAELAPATTHPGILGTSVLEGWDKELTIGLGGSQGDTDEADLRISGLLESKTDTRHWKFDARYELSFADGDIDDNNANISMLHDWLWPSKSWFAFTYGIYDFDEFEAWRHRVTAGAGPGYHLLQWPTFTLDTRFGPFLTYEFGDEDEARPEGAVGLFAKWRFRERHTLEIFDVYFQTLDEGEFRNISNLAWKIRLDINAAVSLKLGIRNEYDSASGDGHIPGDGKPSEKNNLKYFTSIAFDL